MPLRRLSEVPYIRPVRIAVAAVTAAVIASALAGCDSAPAAVVAAPLDAAPAEQPSPGQTPAKPVPDRLPGYGSLACDPGSFTLSESSTIDPDAFDRPNAPKTPRAALERQLGQFRQSSDASARRVADFEWVRTSKGPGRGKVNFAGHPESGRVYVIVTVRRGGESRSWLPVGFEACSPIPSE